MKKILFTAFLFSFVCAFNALQTNAQTVSGVIGAIKRGGTATGRIVIDIPGGLHVNSNRPSSEFAIPTIVKISAAGAKVGGVSYPRGRNRKLSFSEDTINVYEGRVVFTFNVAVPVNYKGNTVNVRVVVRYQACTDEVCYPPKSKDITLTARVR